uniref:Uncharacterized protein n=1 Tax=Rhizophora mucronata TaxID=61149 RepID=A0A2P2PJK5_RHIMU
MPQVPLLVLLPLNDYFTGQTNYSLLSWKIFLEHSRVCQLISGILKFQNTKRLIVLRNNKVPGQLSQHKFQLPLLHFPIEALEQKSFSPP